MQYKLIIDSGATKAEWCAAGRDRRMTVTAGMNLATMSEESALESIAAALDSLGLEGNEVGAVHFYAAGLIAGSASGAMVSSLFAKRFPDADIECASDLLAAARAVCGHSAGVAAILGTGSNSCLFDGISIVRNVRSGGFILGDEGGGASLGKLFLSDFLKGLVPEPIASEFASSFEADYLSIVNRVYHSPAPAAYLGSFAPWILSHADSHPYMRALIDRNLNSFIQRVLLQYDCERVGFVGGFASACASSLKRLCAEAGIEVSSIIASPLENLISYHCQ